MRNLNSTSAIHPHNQLQNVVKIFGGRVTLFKQPQSKNWYARFYLGRKKYSTSTKSDDQKAASKFAEDWYVDTRSRISSGIALPAPKAKSFQVAAEKALEEYEQDAIRGTRSSSYVAGLKRLLKLLCEPMGSVNIEHINQAAWANLKKTLLAKRNNMSDKTLHQYKNGIMVVLKSAVSRGDLKALPLFMRESSGSGGGTSRTWFSRAEYKKLNTALIENIEQHKQNKTRWVEDAEELKDYVSIVINTGLRVGEAMNLRFCDITIENERNRQKNISEFYLEIRHIKGKRGNNGQCKSYYGCVEAFLNCVKRNGLTGKHNSSQLHVFRKYHRDMFRNILKNIGMYYTQDRPPRKRDLMCLRHSYICHRLWQGVPIYDIAANCRTSPLMIEKHYARHWSVLESENINNTPLQDKEEYISLDEIFGE